MITGLNMKSMLKHIMYALILHKIFGILEAAIATTTRREENGSTSQSSAANKFSISEGVFSLEGNLKLSIYNFHNRKLIL